MAVVIYLYPLRLVMIRPIDCTWKECLLLLSNEINVFHFLLRVSREGSVPQYCGSTESQAMRGQEVAREVVSLHEGQSCYDTALTVLNQCLSSYTL